MRKLLLFAAPLLLVNTSTLLAQGVPGGGPPGGEGPPGGGSGRGKPPQPPKPAKRSEYDKLVKQMFEAADADRDGTITIAELHSVVEQQRTARIEHRFKTVDKDGNGLISRPEFVAWQQDMGSAAGQEFTAIGDRDGPIANAIKPVGGKDQDNRMLARLIEPLTGTAIARANSNFDAGVTLDELLAYEGLRFEAADKDHDGMLSIVEMQPDGPGRGMQGMPPPSH